MTVAVPSQKRLVLHQGYGKTTLVLQDCEQVYLALGSNIASVPQTSWFDGLTNTSPRQRLLPNRAFFNLLFQLASSVSYLGTHVVERNSCN